MSIKRDAAFDAFVDQAKGMLGSDLSSDWLFEVWQGADADLNRALNHVLDTPESKMKRSGGGGKETSREAKTPKKHKSSSRESKPAPQAPPTPATTWGDDDDVPASAPLPPAVHHSGPPPPAQYQGQQQAPQYPSQYGAPQQPYGSFPQPGPMYSTQAPPMPYPSAPQVMAPSGFPPSTYVMGGQQPSYMMGGQQSSYFPSQPQFLIDPMTGIPVAPINPAQQAQSMFVQQQQQAKLIQLRAAIDSVLSNPASFTNPQIMQNLQDIMIQALEAPNVTLQLAERARQSQQTAQFIQMMQNQIGQMLSDPKVATNPSMLQQLNSQMNQLRVLTMQHVAQQQIDANPATALTLSMPVLTAPSAPSTMLSRALAQTASCLRDADRGNSPLNRADTDGDWWISENGSKSPRRSSALSEKNPFKTTDEGALSPPSGFNSQSNLNSLRSLSNLPANSPFGMMNSGIMNNGMMLSSSNNLPFQSSVVAPTHPLSAMYSAQQLGGFQPPPHH